MDVVSNTLYSKYGRHLQFDINPFIIFHICHKIPIIRFCYPKISFNIKFFFTITIKDKQKLKEKFNIETNFWITKSDDGYFMA
jgi:hypothetical protein